MYWNSNKFCSYLSFEWFSEITNLLVMPALFLPLHTPAILLESGVFVQEQTVMPFFAPILISDPRRLLNIAQPGPGQPDDGVSDSAATSNSEHRCCLMLREWRYQNMKMLDYVHESSLDLSLHPQYAAQLFCVSVLLWRPRGFSVEHLSWNFSWRPLRIRFRNSIRLEQSNSSFSVERRDRSGSSSGRCR